MTTVRTWHLSLPAEDATAADTRPLFLVLGLPTFALAFAIGVLTTYGSLILYDKTHSTGTTGALLGGEGALALVLPLLVGSLSDRMPHGRLGKRLPFVLLGGPLLLAGLVLLPLSANIIVAAVALLLFFVGYYLYYPPYRALYADMLPRALYAQSQSSQAILRGAGLGVALLSGGVLYGLWKPLPFVVAGVIVLATLAVFRPVQRLQAKADHRNDPDPTPVRELLANPQVRLFALVNALLEFSFAGLRSFVALYVTKGLGDSPKTASIVIGVVAVAYVIGAPIAGKLERRFGIIPVMMWSGILYGIGLCLGSLPTSLGPELILLPFVALAGAVLLTLPQALAFLVAPEGSEGVAAGLIDISRGLGIVLGPLIVGYAVRYSNGLFPATHGYGAMWLVIGVGTLAAVPLLRLLDAHV